MRQWLLERTLLDEVPRACRDEVERALDHDGVWARLDALRASNDRILAELPPAEVAAEVDRRLRVARLASDRRRIRAARRLVWVGSAMAAAAAVLFFLWRGTGAVDESGERVKGDPRLEFHRQLRAGSERVRPGAVVHEGDRLQISYVANGRRYGAILSIDGRGTVTLHYPDRAVAAGRLGQSGAIALPFAYELDDAPDYERFFFVTGARPFDIDLVRSAAQRLAADSHHALSAPLALPPDLAQTSYSFRKGSSP